MDILEQAEQTVKSIHDAEGNDNHELAAKLRAHLAEINEILAADGFAPIEA